MTYFHEEDNHNNIGNNKTINPLDSSLFPGRTPNISTSKEERHAKTAEAELELLQRSLPKRFEHIVQRALETLPDIFSTLPTVLSYNDFGTCNVLVDNVSCELTGVVDWAEAEIAPFGLNRHSYQRFLGAVLLRTGWSRYNDYAATEEAF